MRTLYSNIKQILQTETDLEDKKIVKGIEMKSVSTLEDAWLLTEDGLILDFGQMKDLNTDNHADRYEDLTGRLLLPAWCDSHTHLVFAHSREQEFVDRIHGLTYEEIARRGGGILNSAEKMKTMDEETLYQQSMFGLKRQRKRVPAP